VCSNTSHAFKHVEVQVQHLNTSGISFRAELGYLADGFAFFAVGVGESVIELKVHLKAGGDGEEVSSLRFPVSSGSAECEFRLGQAGFLKRFAEGLGERVELQILFMAGVLKLPSLQAASR
jgi:hypothetical protein